MSFLNIALLCLVSMCVHIVITCVYMCACVCVLVCERECVCARACVCVCECMWVCVHATSVCGFKGDDP